MSKTRSMEQEFVNEVISMLENGTAPWVQGWETGKIMLPDHNPVTGNQYRGINTLILYGTRLRKGYNDTRWLTYKNAAANDWQVRKGERGTPIVFYSIREASEEYRAKHPHTKFSKRKDSAGNVHYYYCIFTYNIVFNAEQVDGIAQLDNNYTIHAWEACMTGEKILNESGANIVYGGSDAFYRPSEDKICLPNKNTNNTNSKREYIP